MANENQNKNFQWKAKLDELETLPDETAMNKNNIWEKLYQRLDEKPQRNKAFLYWAAAACIITISAVFIMNKKENNLTETAEIKNHQSSINNISPLINKNKTAIIIFQKPVIKNQIQAVSKKESKFISTHRHAIIVDPVAVETIASTEMISSIKNNIIPVKDRAIKLLAAAPLKKKLRVVQINELDNTVNTDPSFLADSHFGRGRFQIKLNGNNYFNSEPFASSNLSDNTFKINLSPKN